MTGLIEKLKTQKGILIEHAVIPGANHFFENRVEPLIEEVRQYLDKRLGNPPKLPTPCQERAGFRIATEIGGTRRRWSDDRGT